MMSLLSIAHATEHLNLRTYTPVTSLTSSATPGSWKATTDRGSITAPKIILATNAYTSALLPEYTGKIVPCKGICCHISPSPNAPPPPKLTDTYALRLPGGSHDYLIPRPDGSIIVGGGRSDFLKHRSSWYNNPDDSVLILPAASYFDKYMQTHFVGWEDSGATVDQIWSGIMGYCSDGFPHVGEVPGKKGLYLAAGFEGHGMPVIYLAMAGVAKLIEGKNWGESGIPRVYETTQKRLESERDDYRPKI
jgi:glycine/D-amino acid oxidase-like deaminating enzyme